MAYGKVTPPGIGCVKKYFPASTHSNLCAWKTASTSSFDGCRRPRSLRYSTALEKTITTRAECCIGWRRNRSRAAASATVAIAIQVANQTIVDERGMYG